MNTAPDLRTYEAMIRSAQAHDTLIECVRLLNALGHHLAAEKLLTHVDRIADKITEAA
jgi:hypothetical protein